MTVKAKDGARAVPVAIEMEERPPRTIGAGMSYSTSQSAELHGFWEHRNLRGGAEKLRFDAEAGVERQSLGAALTKPDFGGTTRRTLLLNTGFLHEDAEAYDKTSYTLGGAVTHAFNDRLSASLGGNAEFASIDEADDGPERDYTLLSVPASLKYDSTGNLLDPRHGVRAAAGVTPYYTVNRSNETFVVTELSGSHYLPLAKGGRVVWANRARAGVIFGEATADVPADKRFYAGGGGSVRGYGYQMLGPLDDDNNPTGGRTVMEVGTEMRFRVTDTVGVVPFVEGGRVTKSLDLHGDDEEKFLWAAGIGGRYYTSVGPVRVDIAVPLQRREADDAFQIYFSLGQAF